MTSANSLHPSEGHPMSTTTSSRASEAELLREALKEIRASIFDPVNWLSIACTVWMAKGNETMVDFIDAALSAVPPQGRGQEGVSVKALEWTEDEFGNWHADTDLGREFIQIWRETGSETRVYGQGGSFDTLDAAKAAAQADFERSVRSCLTDTPKPGVSADDLEVLADEIARTRRAAARTQNDDARAVLHGMADALQRIHDALSGLSTPPAAAPAGKEAEISALQEELASTLEELRERNGDDLADSRANRIAELRAASTGEE